MTTTPPLGPTHNPWGFGIDPRLAAAALRAPAASKEDSHPQAILKPSSNSTVPVAWITKPIMDFRLKWNISNHQYHEYFLQG